MVRGVCPVVEEEGVVRKERELLLVLVGRALELGVLVEAGERSP